MCMCKKKKKKVKFIIRGFLQHFHNTVALLIFFFILCLIEIRSFHSSLAELA